jgi:hypothetical protein
LRRRGVPAFQPGPHLAVRLADRGLHPLDPLIDDLRDGLASLALPGLAVGARGLRG